jgi:CCR4-NOT transcription complex subunit 4
MNVLNNSNDDVVECPLCMEPLEVDDLNFYPCTCGYQICRFCWHRIRTDENELCPACRKAYPENPADFTPLSQEQISALKAEKRQRDQQRKQKITENRKHLANVRVVQKNLVFVVGLPPRLADPEILKRHEYFGKYGKIHKVVINPSTTYAGVQGPSASAYVTYLQNNDSLRAIQAVNNIMIDGRLIKTSLGTTKYCSHFMKNQQCPKPDCMYLHELGDPEASFTKEEMHQGKHQEYEKRLHDALIALTQQQSSSTTPPPPTVNGTSDSLGIGIPVVGSPSTIKITETTNTKISPTINGTSNGPIQSKEAWPSLSTSPINKENKINSKTNNSNNGSGGGGKENTIKNSENRKHEKTKNKDTKGNKNNKQNNNSNNNSNSNSNKEQNNRQENILTEKNKQNNNLIINNITDDDSNSLPEFENDDLSNDGKADTPSLR